MFLLYGVFLDNSVGAFDQEGFWPGPIVEAFIAQGIGFLNSWHQSVFFMISQNSPMDLRNLGEPLWTMEFPIFTEHPATAIAKKNL